MWPFNSDNSENEVLSYEFLKFVSLAVIFYYLFAVAGLVTFDFAVAGLVFFSIFVADIQFLRLRV